MSYKHRVVVVSLFFVTMFLTISPTRAINPDEPEKKLSQNGDSVEGATALDPEDSPSTFFLLGYDGTELVFRYLDMKSKINFLEVMLLNKFLQPFFRQIKEILERSTMSISFYEPSQLGSDKALFNYYLSGKPVDLRTSSVERENPSLTPDTGSDALHPPLGTWAINRAVSLDPGRTVDYYSIDDEHDECTTILEGFHVFAVLSQTNNAPGAASDGSCIMAVGYLACAEGHHGYDYSWTREPENANLLLATNWSALINGLSDEEIDIFIRNLHGNKSEIEQVLKLWRSKDDNKKEMAKERLLNALILLMKKALPGYVTTDRIYDEDEYESD